MSGNQMDRAQKACSLPLLGHVVSVGPDVIISVLGSPGKGKSCDLFIPSLKLLGP